MVDDPNKTEGGSFIDDEDFLAADAPDAEIVAERRNFKEIWNQTPSLKIFAVVAGLALVIIIYMIFSGGGDENSKETASAIRSNNNVSQPPGTTELPPAYEEAVRQASEQRAEEAEKTGGSVVPTPIMRPAERIEAPIQIEDNDPLSEWRREAETRRMQRQQDEDSAAAAAIAPPPALPPVTNTAQQPANVMANAQPQRPPLPTGPTPEQISQMAQQLQSFIQQSVLEPQTPKESVMISLPVAPGYDIKKYFPDPPETTTPGGNANVPGGSNNPNLANIKPMIPAGTISYAQFILEANSDIPGPVLAEVASGPLTGGRAIGQFQTANDRYLIVQFNRIVKDGVEYPVQAIAINPATTLTGVATDVDRHYFSRVLIPAAAEFVRGYAEAATRTDTNVVVTNGTVITNNTNDLDSKQELLQGVNEAAQKLGDVVEDDLGDRPVTVRIQAGTRVGILFMEGVYDPQDQQQINQANYQQQQQQGGYGQYGQNMLNTITGSGTQGLMGGGQNYYSNNAQQRQQPAAAPGTYGAVQQQRQGSQVNTITRTGLNR